MSDAFLYEVAIKTPVRRLFTYESSEPLTKGARVLVPFRTRERVGIVWSETSVRPDGLRKIEKKIDSSPIFDEQCLKFYQQAAEYYGISLGELLSASIPKKIRDGGEIPTYPDKHFVPELPDLSPLQKEVFEKIKAKPGFEVHLILGETGSGKTEIYLHLMESILMEGGQILFLVPEISLTPQLEDRLAQRLGTRVSVFHSNMKESKRLEVFSRAWKGQTDVFLGARSALFLPFKHLRLVIVDEEHDASYKQSERMPHHARDLAILKSKLFNIPIVLGSATPSVESYARTQEQKTPLYRLPKFYETPQPEIEIISLKKVWKEGNKTFISEPLHRLIESSLGKKEQCLLFLNRRGSATQKICLQCGKQETCSHCSSTLTLHFDVKMGICHLCGFKKPLRSECEDCSGKEFFIGGIGTKEIEQQIQSRFPEARIARLDRDQTQKRHMMSDILRDFADAKIDILIGTQMISKGLDIPGLSAIGIILADQGWGVPDFRAMERSFQLLKQVLGRAGRRGQSSKCLIQTFFPEHPIFSYLGNEEAYDAFITNELEIRRAASLPPYNRLLLWTLSDRTQSKAFKAAETLVFRISRIAKALQVEILGPMEAPLFRWKSQYRYQILAKCPSHGRLSQFMGMALQDLEERPLGVKIRTDRDPYHFL